MMQAVERAKIGVKAGPKKAQKIGAYKRKEGGHQEKMNISSYNNVTCGLFVTYSQQNSSKRQF